MKIFEIANLGNLILKNRLIRSATWENLAEIDGSIVEIPENNLSKVEIIHGIKNSTNLHVTIKINCSDFVDGGNDFEKSLEICKILAEN